MVFIEPYPKSKVAQLYNDSIVLDAVESSSHVTFKAFVGVAPRSYVSLFSSPVREGISWENVRATAKPRFGTHISAYAMAENQHVGLIAKRFAE